MKTRCKINEKNLKQLCWQVRGVTVKAFAEKLFPGSKSARVMVHRAIKYPEQYPSVYKKITEALSE